MPFSPLRTWAPVFSAWRKVSQLWPVKPRSATALQRMRILIPLYLRPVAALRGRPRGALTPPHGCTQGTRPCSSSATILLVISWYRLLRSEKDLWAGAGWGMGDLRDGRTKASLSPCCTRHGPGTALFLSLTGARPSRYQPGWESCGSSRVSASAGVIGSGPDAPRVGLDSPS